MEQTLYIHIPFCKSKCLYCSFYSIAYKDQLIASYISVLVKQIRRLKGKFKSIYIGGGTPTVIPDKQLAQFINSLSPVRADNCEFTIEANPDSLDNEKLAILSGEGVNRLSIGIQSFDDGILKKLGRIHNAKHAEEAVYKAKEKGFNNISVDLIFGIWGQTLDDWSKELAHAAQLPVTHMSCYSLTYEKNTPLLDLVDNGSVRPISDEVSADMYAHTINYLPEKGFLQYEVSNFAKENYLCQHNMHYWKNNSYLAFGPSSVSYINGMRQVNVSDVVEYTERVDRGESTVLYSENLEAPQRAKETAALKIRTADGIDYSWFKKKTGFVFLDIEKNVLAELKSDGLIQYNRDNGENSGIALTKKGFLFCDTVSSALL